MAKNWFEAQKNEKHFWEEIYLNKANKDTYEKINISGAVGFTNQVVKRHKKKLKHFDKKKNC